MRNLGLPLSGMFDERANSCKLHVAQAPSGKLTTVFSDPRERKGTSDFLENYHVNAQEIAKNMFDPMAKRARSTGHFAEVAVDGTSLRLTEEKLDIGFGRIGSDDRGARGLKVMNAYCIAADGAPLGLIHQSSWPRAPNVKTAESLQKSKAGLRKRPFEQKPSYSFFKGAAEAINTLK